MLIARIRTLIVGLAVMAMGAMAFAQDEPPGFGAMAQYRIGVGARALGLGGAFTAVSDGVEGLYWNPAALPRSTLTAGGMYSQPYAGLGGDSLGIRVQYIGLVGPYEGIGLGAGWFNFHVSDIPYTDNDGGTFDYDSSVFLLGFGLNQVMGDGIVVGLGATGKLYREQMLTASAQGLGWDIGVLVDFGQWRVAYCSQDVGGTRYRWQGTGQEPLMMVPWVHRIGVTALWLDGTVITSGDVVIEQEALPIFRLGSELWLAEGLLAFRGGIRLEGIIEGEPQILLTLGFGVAWEAFLLDVAYLRNPIPMFEGSSDLSTDTYVISLGVRF